MAHRLQALNRIPRHRFYPINSLRSHQYRLPVPLRSITTMSSVTTIYDFKPEFKKSTFDMSELKGKVVLIVNTASQCGFTPQFEGLEAVYQKYKDQGLAVIGFPCNQFGSQDPDSNENITSFCQVNCTSHSDVADNRRRLVSHHEQD